MNTQVVNYDKQFISIDMDHIRGAIGKMRYIDKRSMKIKESFGMIAARYKNDEFEYLLVCRKYSVGMCDLILGISFITVPYLKRICSQLTLSEANIILYDNISSIWSNCMGRSIYTSDTYTNFNKYAKHRDWRRQIMYKRFTAIRNNITFRKILKSVKNVWKDAGWGFPKGRRRIKDRECQIDCASREFEEETGICKGEYRLIRNNSNMEFVEQYIGSNYIIYRNCYYVVMVSPLALPTFNPHVNINQKYELSHIGWFNLDDAKSKIRYTDTTKLDCLEAAERYLKKNCSLFNENNNNNKNNNKIIEII